MDYRQADRLIREFKRNRQDWLDILVNNPDASDAARAIMTINSKIELLRTMRQYPENYDGDFE